MKKLLLPLLLLIIGTGAGAGAGFFLKPEPETEAEVTNAADAITCPPAEHLDVAHEAPPPALEEGVIKAYAKLNNQFIVPIVADERIDAMVAISLTIEVIEGDQTIVFAAEPKLRDAFLQVMFDHANIGGFAGNFTSATNMRALRQELNRAAWSIVGKTAIDVLILDIVRQDV